MPRGGCDNDGTLIVTAVCDRLISVAVLLLLAVTA